MFLKLTALEIENAWINVDKVEAIYTENGVTQITFTGNGNGVMAVRETPEEITEMIFCS